jgi:hypothetical protein
MSRTREEVTGVKTRAGLVWQGLDEVKVEGAALAALHARWAARTGVSPDPQMAASSREIVRLVNGVMRHLTLIEGNGKATPELPEAA